MINLNHGRKNTEHISDGITVLKDLEHNLTNENFEQIAQNEYTGKMLHNIGSAYYAQLVYNHLLQKKADVRSVRMTLAGLTSVNLKIEHLIQ